MPPRRYTHDPKTGRELPTFVNYIPAEKPCKGGRRASPRYRLVVPQAALRERGAYSKNSAVFSTLDELLASDMYKKIKASEMRHYLSGNRMPKRTSERKAAAVREYERVVGEGIAMSPHVVFRPASAVWSVTRSFGTGWTFRATAHSYEEGLKLYNECANVQNTKDVVGDGAPEAIRKISNTHSRKILSHLHVQRADGEEDDEREEVEEVEVEAVEVDTVSDTDIDHETSLEVDEVQIRASRSGRVPKRPNPYGMEPPHPQKRSRKANKAVVGQPVAVVAASTAAASEQVPVYDGTDEVRSLKAIREQIARLL